MNLCRCFSHCCKGLIAASLVFGMPSAHARETVIWANLHFPPWMILEGPSKGKGVWDELLVYLTANLPEYDHRMLVMKNVRFEEMVREDQNVCKVYYFKTPEREKLLHFSSPSVVFLANHVVMRREKAALLDKPPRVSLEKLMSDTRMKGTVIEGRSYGKVIDDIIARHVGEKHINNPVVDNQSLFEFLNLGRTDYILEFPAVRSFFEQDLTLKPDVVNMAIEEGQPYNITYVACVKNDFGKRVIGRVNTLIKERVASDAHKNATLRWYLPGDQQELEKYYKRILLSPSPAQVQ
jgi:polar amino acid transport system substrate-binding protein